MKLHKSMLTLAAVALSATTVYAGTPRKIVRVLYVSAGQEVIVVCDDGTAWEAPLRNIKYPPAARVGWLQVTAPEQ